MLTRIATFALTGLLGLAGAVAAEDAGVETVPGPALVLRVDGACPDAAQVRAALPAGVEVASADAAEAASADGAGRARGATL
ncbi:MAG: hypothetical protein HS111_09285 [Kofleriaceae bacterium]|nr:hypothetical protein [Kofleriaceae bacterium]